MTIATDYTAILYASDGQPDYTWNGITALGAPVIVTYSFVESASLAFWEAASVYVNDGYTSLTIAQRANFRDALALYEQAAGVVFVRVASGQGMINAINTSGSAYGGWANTAISTTTETGSGELVIDSSGNYAEGSYGFQIILHELGHAMGLEHPWEGGITLDPNLDNQVHTVMTYNTTIPSTARLGSLDVAAMQALYGATGATAGWVISMAAGVLTVTGSGGADTILGVAGRNLLNGAGGNDRAFGRQANDTLLGGAGADTLSGNSGADVLRGGGGNDVLYGFAVSQVWTSGDDRLFGGGGLDRLIGSHNADTLYGGAGGDALNGQSGGDALYGGLGGDTLRGDGNVQYGGSDTLYGDEGSDRIFGDASQDSLFGGAGNDTLDGGAGFDTLDGGAGDDILIGRGDNSIETVTFGAGFDVIRFGAGDMGSQYLLTDFVRGEDVIQLRGMGLSFADVENYGGRLLIGTLWIETAVAGQVTASDFVF